MKTANKLFWIYLLSGAIYFTQGIEGLPGLPFFFFLKEKLHLDASSIMYLSLVTSIAWGIKPLYGFLVDNYFTKKTFILASLVGSAIICLFLGISNWIILPILITAMSLMSLTTAIRDVSVDGIMCVDGKETNNCDRIQTCQWTAITIAGIIVSLAGGYIADKLNYKFAYLLLIPIYVLIIAIVMRYKPTNTCTVSDKKKVSIIQTIKSYKVLFTNKSFLLGALFIFVYNFAPGFGTPLMFIERDTFHWSGTFMGIVGAISSAVGIIGALIYFKYSKKINIKKCLFASVFLVGAINLCYLYFTPVSAIIYSILFSILGMFIFLNMMSFMAKSTLSGMEATSFALLCSVNNLSGMFSTLTGAWLFPRIGLNCIIIISACSAFLSLPILMKLKIEENRNGL